MPKDKIQGVPNLPKLIKTNVDAWLNSSRTLEDYFESQFPEDFNNLPPSERIKIAALYELNKVKQIEVLLNHNAQTQKIALERERIALERERIELQKLHLEKIESPNNANVFQSPQDYFKNVGFEDLEANLERSKSVEQSI